MQISGKWEKVDLHRTNHVVPVPIACARLFRPNSVGTTHPVLLGVAARAASMCGLAISAAVPPMYTIM